MDCWVHLSGVKYWYLYPRVDTGERIVQQLQHSEWQFRWHPQWKFPWCPTVETGASIYRDFKHWTNIKFILNQHKINSSFDMTNCKVLHLRQNNTYQTILKAAWQADWVFPVVMMRPLIQCSAWSVASLFQKDIKKQEIIQCRATEMLRANSRWLTR